MGTQRRLVAGVVLAGAATAASAVAYPDLPARVAIHFDASGTPDDYASRRFATAFVPALVLGLLAFFEALARVDSVREDLEASTGVYDATVIGTLALLAFVHGLLLAFNLGYDVPTAAATAVGVVVAACVVAYTYVASRRRRPDDESTAD